MLRYTKARLLVYSVLEASISDTRLEWKARVWWAKRPGKMGRDSERPCMLKSSNFKLKTCSSAPGRELSEELCPIIQGRSERAWIKIVTRSGWRGELAVFIQFISLREIWFTLLRFKNILLGFCLKFVSVKIVVD